MRTQDPAVIRSDFLSSLIDIETAFKATQVGVADEQAKKLVAEYLFVATATLFEGYLSDLFVAYINRDSEKLRGFLISKISIDAEDEYARRAVKHVESSIPHLSVDRIKEILDPSGYNITFKTTAKMKEAAGTWLSDADKAHIVGVSAAECAVIDFIKAVRNYLAHRSEAARAKMDEALFATDLPDVFRRNANAVTDVGAYLLSRQSTLLRFEHALNQVRQLGAKFCP
jgi:hypothetical protein